LVQESYKLSVGFCIADTMFSFRAVALDGGAVLITVSMKNIVDIGMELYSAIRHTPLSQTLVLK